MIVITFLCDYYHRLLGQLSLSCIWELSLHQAAQPVPRRTSAGWKDAVDILVLLLTVFTLVISCLIISPKKELWSMRATHCR